MKGKNVLFFLYFLEIFHLFNFGRTTTKVITKFERNFTKSLEPKVFQLKVSIMFTTELNSVSF
jgi:hypothetical protein